MSKQAETLDERLAVLQDAQQFHKKVRNDLQELYSYHHRMITHLADQIEQLEKGVENER